MVMTLTMFHASFVYLFIYSQVLNFQVVSQASNQLEYFFNLSIDHECFYINLQFVGVVGIISCMYVMYEQCFLVSGGSILMQPTNL